MYFLDWIYYPLLYRCNIYKQIPLLSQLGSVIGGFDCLSLRSMFAHTHHYLYASFCSTILFFLLQLLSVLTLFCLSTCVSNSIDEPAPVWNQFRVRGMHLGLFCLKEQSCIVNKGKNSPNLQLRIMLRYSRIIHSD